MLQQDLLLELLLRDIVMHYSQGMQMLSILDTLYN